MDSLVSLYATLRRHANWTLLIVCVGLVGALYHEALWLPYFFDDLDHVPFAMENSFAAIWRSPGGFPYFRPLGVSALRLIGVLFGVNAIAHHALNLSLHAINGFLVGHLAGRLNSAEKLPRAVLAATLFIIFPFSYQAVPWVDTVYHLIVTTLLLLAVNSYLQYRDNQQPVWRMVAALCLLLAPFAHENGLIGGGLIALWHLFGPFEQTAQTAWAERIPPAIAWLIPGMVAFFISTAVPSNSRSALALNGAETLWQNTTYYTQGLIFPVSWAGNELVQRGANDLQAVWLLAAVALLFTVAAKRRHPLYPFSLIWFVAGSTLAVAFLNFQYVIDGARLLMVASVGAALFWAQLLIDGWRKRWLRPVIGVLLVTCIVVNGRFVRDTLNTHRVLGEGFWHVVNETTRENPSTEQVVFVNMVEWAASQRLQFAVGHEGAMFRPTYIPPHRIVSGLYPMTRQPQFIKDHATLPNWPYHFEATHDFSGWSTDTTEVFQLHYSAETATKQHIGTTNVAFVVEAGPLATFTLADATIVLHTASISTVDKGVVVELVWEAIGQPAAHHKLFIHALDANGQLVGQSDGVPFNGLLPWDQWGSGATMLDRREIEASEVAHVLVGLYDGLTGERWEAISAENRPYSNNAVPLRP